MSEQLVSAIAQYTERKAVYDAAKAELEKAKAAVMKQTDGKIPTKVVVGTKFIVISKDEDGLKIHITQLDGIYGQGGSPVPKAKPWNS